MNFDFLNYLAGLGNWLYLFVFLGMLIEGNTTMFIVGFLLSLQALNAFALLSVAFAGALLEQFFWFWLGIKIKKSSSKIAKWIINASNHFDEHFIHRPKTTLLVSKFIYGIHRAAIARAGVLGIKTREYIQHIIPVLLLWMLIIGGVGFVIKESLSWMGRYFRYAEMILLGILIAVILIQRFVISGKLKEVWKRI